VLYSGFNKILLFLQFVVTLTARQMVTANSQTYRTANFCQKF
jgi:hypothetical protein